MKPKLYTEHLKENVKNLNEQARSFKKIIADRDIVIENLHQLTDNLEKVVSDKGLHIDNLEKIVSDKDLHIESLSKHTANIEEIIAYLR